MMGDYAEWFACSVIFLPLALKILFYAFLWSTFDFSIPISDYRRNTTDDEDNDDDGDKNNNTDDSHGNDGKHLRAMMKLIYPGLFHEYWSNNLK